MWRRIHVVRYVRKNATVTDWTGSFAAAQAYYRPAFMEMVNGIGGQKYLYSAHRLANGTVPTYNALAEARRFDPKVVIEAAAVGAREIECGVLQGLGLEPNATSEPTTIARADG